MTLDRSYGVAEKPIPAQDIEDLGPVTPDTPSATGKPAESKVQFDEYYPFNEDNDALGDVLMEQSHREMERLRESGGNPFDLLFPRLH